ncbi:hypothetical protein A1F94_005615 [Pyrenophora tritici-repentis]|uniref:Herpes-BLLF1 domain containing protein n=1 Tax=Pyrenophora tritici-repentis TaxID=45151 RepID=A0A2W1H3H7_9PLEO|nr:hypothetical protein PtrV1_08315 [Pyrenophora tritici-repentis]KAF7570630.1 Herpes-BLLF1 domain containing protein [Pyrenophora tritici-repentis]KAG9383704.1 hypothetical protein A1F94_005615 [Pyrenophora tritici-repentis]KAI0585274.1 hypothetical protein Alg215_02665 [Pyrenophora tritici-repentis]KAI0590864.1 hypothetical protein Alg130_01896 [Pyrenophora tritici-repentis]
MLNMRRETHSTDVIADINYFPALGTPIPKSEWKPRYLDSNDAYTRPMLIRDVRTSVKPFNLDVHGFQFVQLPEKKTRVTRDDDEETVKRKYYPELEDIAKKITDASTAHVFNHVMRAHSSPSEKGIQDSKGRWQDIPAGHPHVDYAGSSAAIEGTKLELNFPPHISKLFDTSTRFAFLGAWRPLKTVRKDPLAVCDATTVPDYDYQVRLREFSRTGIKSENYVMSHRDEEQKHQWYYMSEMQPWEMVVFKGFDTKRDSPGWRCPHTAFRLQGSQEEPPRESIEARIVCFWG